jgi:nitrite reductase (cytochrome c-552)
MMGRIFFCFVFVLLALLVSACRATPVVVPPPLHNGNGGVGVRVISAEEWFGTHPDVVESYWRNYDNDIFYSYLEKNPYMSVLFEGFGFAVSYNSPRGHVYSMYSTDNTGRPTLRANCFTCKSANYPAIAEEMGIEFFSTPFEELRALMTQPISCFNCHGNEPGTPRVMSQFLLTALDCDAELVSPGSLSCAQCHVEYHFDPVSWHVVLPYAGLTDMYPTAMLDYFNNTARMPDGQPYADYVNPRSGVRQIKVQHPEFETVYGRGSVHNSLMPGPMAYSCSDCHMPREVNERGTPYISHEWMSPLNNMQLIQGDCSACHADITSEVRAIQDDYQVRVHELGSHLAGLMERLVLAVDSGRHTEEVLDEIRGNFRNAQFFWDFVVSENSNGAHNPRLLFRTIDYGWEYARQVEDLLERIGH